MVHIVHSEINGNLACLEDMNLTSLQPFSRLTSRKKLLVFRHAQYMYMFLSNLMLNFVK